MDKTDKTKLRATLGKLLTLLLPIIQKLSGNRFSLAGLAGLTAGVVDLLVEATDALNTTGEAVVMGSVVGAATLIATMKKKET